MYVKVIFKNWQELKNTDLKPTEKYQKIKVHVDIMSITVLK